MSEEATIDEATVDDFTVGFTATESSTTITEIEPVLDVVRPKTSTAVAAAEEDETAVRVRISDTLAGLARKRSLQRTRSMDLNPTSSHTSVIVDTQDATFTPVATLAFIHQRSHLGQVDPVALTIFEQIARTLTATLASVSPDGIKTAMRQRTAAAAPSGDSDETPVVTKSASFVAANEIAETVMRYGNVASATPSTDPVVIDLARTILAEALLDSTPDVDLVRILISSLVPTSDVAESLSREAPVAEAAAAIFNLTMDVIRKRIATLSWPDVILVLDFIRTRLAAGVATAEEDDTAVRTRNALVSTEIIHVFETLAIHIASSVASSTRVEQGAISTHLAETLPAVEREVSALRARLADVVASSVVQQAAHRVRASDAAVVSRWVHDHIRDRAATVVAEDDDDETVVRIRDALVSGAVSVLETLEQVRIGALDAASDDPLFALVRDRIAEGSFDVNMFSESFFIDIAKMARSSDDVKLYWLMILSQPYGRHVQGMIDALRRETRGSPL